MIFVVSVLAMMLGPVAAARSGRRERLVLFLGTASSALGTASMFFLLFLAMLSYAYQDEPNPSISSSEICQALAVTFGPAALLLAGAAVAAARRMTTTARVLAVAPIGLVFLLFALLVVTSFL